MRIFSLLLLFCLCAPVCWCDEVFPRPGWQDVPNPLASAQAVVGGEMSIYAGPSPDSLNYFLDNNTFSFAVFNLMYETLIGDDPLTLEEVPGIAEKWSVSDDKKKFTFWINPKAKWSDGQPITAADVKWTFDTLMNPKNMTGVHKVALEKFETPEILDERTIRFTAKEVHWGNLVGCGEMFILPKHAFEKLDFNLINFEFPVVSGMYALGKIKPGISIALNRRDDWWGRSLPSSRGVGNFHVLNFRMYESRENAYDAFLKGEIDLFPAVMARVWAKETNQKKFLKNWVVKQKVSNYNPIGLQGLAMNMRKPPFNDRRVRLAMAHLINREKCNASLLYNMYFMHKAYFENAYDAEYPCKNEPFTFDKQKARTLLAEAGWKANPATGLLEKDGKPFSFKFLASSPILSKYLVIFQQDLKDVGIEMTIDQKDWAAYLKDMDDYHFDMAWSSWTSSLRDDPEGMWHSKEADRKGSSNTTGFKSAELDALIEQQKSVFDIQDRKALLRKIDALIYNEYPYVLLWNLDYQRLLYWNKFGTPATVLSRFDREEAAYRYWWTSADAREELHDAVRHNWALPRKEFDIRFDEKFKKP